MTIIRKLLLYKHISWTQLVGFFMAGFIGMGIVLFGIQAWSDVHPFFSPKEGFIKNDYIVITKKVGALSLLNKRGNQFSPQEQEDIGQQSFAENLGAFTASRFSVSAGIQLPEMGVGFSTDMFFESVPDAFVDVKTNDWAFDPGKNTIPIILPRNYLNLYNFGFAQSRNLPKISEGVIGMISLDVRIRGNGRHDAYKGKIVGFSNRLNTILVPEPFMTWANQLYGEGSAGDPVRLIIETQNPANKEIAHYIREKGYEAENDKLNDGSVVWFLNLLTTFVVAIGLLICLLSLYLLTISIYLIIQKNSDKLKSLSLLGYRTRDIAAPYQSLVIGVNAVVVTMAILTLLICRGIYIPFLTKIWPEFTPSTFWPAILSGAVLFILTCSLNIIAVRARVKKVEQHF